MVHGEKCGEAAESQISNELMVVYVLFMVHVTRYEGGRLWGRRKADLKGSTEGWPKAVRASSPSRLLTCNRGELRQRLQ